MEYEKCSNCGRWIPEDGIIEDSYNDDGSPIFLCHKCKLEFEE